MQVIQEKEGHQGTHDVQYTCRCSFLQIYQENISDLLRPHPGHGGHSLPLRSSPDSGVFVEGLSEHVIVNGAPPWHSSACMIPLPVKSSLCIRLQLFSQKAYLCVRMELRQERGRTLPGPPWPWSSSLHVVAALPGCTCLLPWRARTASPSTIPSLLPRGSTRKHVFCNEHMHGRWLQRGPVDALPCVSDAVDSISASLPRCRRRAARAGLARTPNPGLAAGDL